MHRRERRLFAITDQIARLRETLQQVRAELQVLQHLQDDARRDAAGGGPIEREDAREGERDVARFHRLVADLSRQIERLDGKRVSLMTDLDRDG